MTNARTRVLARGQCGPRGPGRCARDVEGVSMIEVRVDSSRPIFMTANADSFGELFASMDSDEQIEVFRAMVKHMGSWRTQWDHISIALELDENSELRETLREVLFPAADDNEPPER